MTQKILTSFWKAKASPPRVNSRVRMTVTMIPNVTRTQWDSNKAPQQPRNAIKKTQNPRTMTLYGEKSRKREEKVDENEKNESDGIQ